MLRTDVKKWILTSMDFSPYFRNLRNPSKITFTFKEFWRCKHHEFRSSLAKKLPQAMSENLRGEMFSPANTLDAWNHSKITPF